MFDGRVCKKMDLRCATQTFHTNIIIDLLGFAYLKSWLRDSLAAKHRMTHIVLSYYLVPRILFYVYTIVMYRSRHMDMRFYSRIMWGSSFIIVSVCCILFLDHVLKGSSHHFDQPCDKSRCLLKLWLVRFVPKGGSLINYSSVLRIIYNKIIIWLIPYFIFLL
jgi:hypothetical protein